MSDSVFSTNWYRNFLAFQRNPKAFVDNRKLRRDDFCMDMLKDLYSDAVSSQCKCHLLLALQEHQSYLVQSETLLEQIVGSLQNLYGTLQTSGENKLLKSNIIVTMTTLLLTSESTSDIINKVCVSLKNMLLDTIFTEARDRVLRSTACQCLEEIELFFPGSLTEEIDSLLSAVQRNQLPPVQNYVTLLSACLKNKLDQQLKVVADNVKSQDTVVVKIPRRLSSAPEIKGMQIHHLVACMLDVLSVMSEMSVYTVFRKLIYIVEKSSDLLPAVFKPFLSKLIMSFDVLHFHLAFILLNTFGSDLFTSHEEKLLLQQLLICIGHPSLSTSHHLLYLDWMKTFIQEKKFSINLPFSCLEVLVPGPFDGPYMQEKKIALLCLYLQGLHENVSSPEFLMTCLEGLKRHALLNCRVTTVSSFFRSLFNIVMSMERSLTEPIMKRLILDIISSSPKLSPFVLDFLKCTKTENLKNDSIYSVLVKHVLNLTPKQYAQDVSYFLPILEEAVIEAPNVSKPQVIIRQLKKVLMEPAVLDSDTWTIGHSVLSLCSHFLRFHDVEILYYDLGELLNLVMKNIKNCDCQDRAKQYYAALTFLPQARVKELFKNESFQEKGSETTFYSRAIKPIKPIFELLRMERSIHSFPQKIEIKKSDHNEGLKHKYIEFINSEIFQPVVKIPFILRHLKCASEEFATVYCIVVTIQSSPECSEISDIELPVLKRTTSDTDQGVVVNVEFTPKVPTPTVLHLRAYFTSSDGFSYKFHLPSVTLELQDLFCPLPVSVEDDDVQQELFDELWKEMETDKNNSCLSVFQLPFCDANLHAFVQTHWKHFVISASDSTCCIGIFLPSSSHLLLKVKTLNDAGLVTVLTHKKILPFVSVYMDHVISMEVNKT